MLEPQLKLDLKSDYLEHIEKTQNVVGNFMRTGDPNNWDGNPRPTIEMPKLDHFRDSKKFNIFGMDGIYQDAYRSSFCDKLDAMDEYMLH